MEFWIFFVCVCIGFMFLERIVPEKYKRFVPMCFMFFITFIAAFRYQIGWDYDSYVFWFDKVEMGDLYPEVSFQIIATFFREKGLSAQAMFILYAILTSIFIWKGLLFYLKKTDEIIFALIVFVGIKVLYWDLMFGYIRQGLAVAIFFWATQFIIKKSFYRYFLSIIICSLIHFSSITLLVCYFIPQKTINKHKVYLFIFLTGIFYFFATQIMVLITEYMGIYQSLIDHGVVRSTLLINLIIGIWAIILCQEPKWMGTNQKFIFNMYVLSIITGLFFGFSVATYRISMYFQVFQGLFFVLLVKRFTNKSQYLFKSIVVIGLLFLFLLYANATNNNYYSNNGGSANNINYTFNFKLFQ